MTPSSGAVITPGRIHASHDLEEKTSKGRQLSTIQANFLLRTRAGVYQHASVGGAVLPAQALNSQPLEVGLSNSI
jgi:hypothetical protein